MAIKVSKNVLWKAIRAQCVECMGGQMYDVSGCSAKKCSLYPFRMGCSAKAEVTEEMRPKRSGKADYFLKKRNTNSERTIFKPI